MKTPKEKSNKVSGEHEKCKCGCTKDKLTSDCANKGCIECFPLNSFKRCCEKCFVKTSSGLVHCSDIFNCPCHKPFIPSTEERCKHCGVNKFKDGRCVFCAELKNPLPKHDMGLEEKIEEICRDNDVWWVDDGKWNVTNNIDFIDAMKLLLQSEKEKTRKETFADIERTFKVVWERKAHAIGEQQARQSSISQVEEIIEGMKNKVLDEHWDVPFNHALDKALTAITNNLKDK